MKSMSDRLKKSFLFLACAAPVAVLWLGLSALFVALAVGLDLIVGIPPQFGFAACVMLTIFLICGCLLAHKRLAANGRRRSLRGTSDSAFPFAAIIETISRDENIPSAH